MNSEPAAQPPSPEDEASRLNRYKLVRDEISHEDNLMGSRLGWFTSSQSFLLTGLAIAQGGRMNLPMRGNNYLFPLVPIVAITSDILILVGVLAGIQALRRWRSMLPGYEGLPRIQKDRWIIGLGWAAPLGLPLVFLLAWIYLLIAGCFG